MSNSPVTPATTDGENKDASLGPRRLVAFIISFGLGALIVSLLIIFYLKAGLDASFPMAFIPNVPLLPLATLPMGFFFLIWVDYFMGTKIIPD
jgi:hypothetical protein